MPQMKMVHKVDPRKEIFDKVGLNVKEGKIPGYELHGNRVLVGVYVRPSMTASGIHIPNQTQDEDKHQGKAAVVIMKGQSAFKSDRDYDFGTDDVKVGDWVMLFVSHGPRVIINGQTCRIVRDQDIAMRIPEPDAVF